MIDLFSLLGIGIAAFAASNIDDTFVLILLFSTPNIQARHVVIRQFLGIELFVIVSALGSLIALVVPIYVIGSMGLVPIGIGIKRLLELREHENLNLNKETTQINKKAFSSLLTVAVVTISNGADDVGFDM